MFERAGRSIYRTRWIVVAFWLAALAISAAFAPRVSSILHGGGYDVGNSQSVAAYSALNHAYGWRALIFTAVFTARKGSRSELYAAATRFRNDATSRLGRGLSISSPVRTPDGVALFERIYSSPQQDFGTSFASTLRGLLPHSAVRGYLTGPAAIYHDMEIASDQDLQHVELVTLPLAALVLIGIFGSVVASATPVLMAPVSVTMALALIYFIGHRVDMSIFVLNTTSMLGLGVAIDYSLLMVNRFREELQQGKELEAAVGTTVATAGRAILVSALVVSVGFYGLTLSGVTMLRSLGLGGSIVTVLSLLVALTLLPAVLGIMGDRINRLSIVPQRFSSRGVWRALALKVMRYPAPVIGAVTVAVVLLGAPAFHLRPGVPGPEILPPSVDSRAGNDILNAHLGTANSSPVLVVVLRDAGTSISTYQAAAFTALDRICSSPEVVGLATVPIANSPRQIRSCQDAFSAFQNPPPSAVRRATRLSRRDRVGLISVFLRSKPSSAAAERFVASLRSSLAIPGYRVLIGGQTAGQMDFNHYLYSRFPTVIIVVIIAIFVILLLAFRSVLLPLKAVLMNVFSVLAAYGVVVFSFQDAHLASLLAFTPVGNVDSIVPVMLFCVLFGISTDYEVFLLTRVQEEYLRTGNNEGSVATGLEVTGRIITSAATVMIVVFAAFAFAQLVVVKEIGLGLAAAVLVDASLIRALLVPATMRLLGRWNWWLPVRGYPRASPQTNDVVTGKSPAAG